MNTRQTVAVADVHGHLSRFRRLLKQLDAELGDYQLVSLGDYVDNGPDIPGLLDFLIELKAERGDGFVPIIGNHDLACLRALGWNGGPPDEAWWRQWSSRYWDPGMGTPAQYGANSAHSFAAQFPRNHRDFLQALPWFHDDGEHFFVHAGLDAQQLEPQREALRDRIMPVEPDYLPGPIRDKALSVVSHADWSRVVISGHTKGSQIARLSPQHAHLPHFMTKHRITLSAEVDATGVLYAVVLPERRFVRVSSPYP